MQTGSQNTQIELVEKIDAIARQLFDQKLFYLAGQQEDIGFEIMPVPNLLTNAAMCYYHAHRFDLALDRLYKLTEIDQTSPWTTYKDIASYLRWLGRYSEAEEIVKKRVLPVRDNVDAQNSANLALGWFEMQKGNFRESFALTELSRQTNGNKFWYVARKHPIHGRLWRGEDDISNDTLLVCAESGQGDEIIFARWLHQLKKMSKKVYYHTNTALAPIIARNFDIEILNDPIENVYTRYVPSMSIPYALKSEDPKPTKYLSADTAYIEKWNKKLPSKQGLRIAINWSGDPGHLENKFRSLPKDQLINKLKQKGNLISICKSDRSALPLEVFDAAKDLNTWDDTLAVMELCDVIVTSCTSVAHAAGALGKKTYVLVNLANYFTWCHTPSGEKTDWYDNVTVLRQTNMDSWDDVFEELDKCF